MVLDKPTGKDSNKRWSKATVVAVAIGLLLATGAAIATALILTQGGRSHKGLQQQSQQQQHGAAAPPPQNNTIHSNLPARCRIHRRAKNTTSEPPATVRCCWLPRTRPGTAGQFTCRIYSSEGVNSQLELQLSFLDANNTQVGATVDLSTFAAQPWTRAAGNTTANKAKNVPKLANLGVIYEGLLEIATDAPPEFLALQIGPAASVDKEHVGRIEIFQEQEGVAWEICMAPNTWVHRQHGRRTLPTSGEAYLPSETPPHLRTWRKAELAAVQGTAGDRKTERKEGDRVYDYDVYNDLAGLDDKGRLLDRPILGGSSEYPYPRRIRTGRARIAGPNGSRVYETRKTSDMFWVPLDERFPEIKNADTQSFTAVSVIPALAARVRRKLYDRDHRLTNFREVDAMFSTRQDARFGLKPTDLVLALQFTTSATLKQLGIDNLLWPQLGFMGDIQGVILTAVGAAMKKVKQLATKGQALLKFPQPLVKQRRAGAWQTDAEFGRQALAGTNPTAVRAVTSKADLGSITARHLKPFIETFTLEALVAMGKSRPRLLVINHTRIFREYAERITKQGSKGSGKGTGRYGYWGRCLLYLSKDGLWRPIAIELQGWDEKKPTVYTPKDHKNLWQLAKGVFLTLDSAHHQLISHWLRCHAATEPYIIATHRALSSLHPVFKLLAPHWRHTMHVNSNSRGNLINADGIIERGFTAGRYAGEMTAKIYGTLWRFNKQGLPTDLIERGFAKRGPGGKVKLLLKDYPYADDGMLLWNAIEEWVGQYLRLYYNDSDPKKSVTGDAELMAWWQEIRTKGHPDVREGWPQLKTVEDLREILTTMIWVASGHHAATNFGQYGYSGYFLNRPSIVTKAIPRKGTQAYQRLVGSREGGEQVYLETLHNDGTEAVTFMLQLLSAHAANEVYLGNPDHAYILDERALALHDKFASRLQAAEREMQRRNKSKEWKLRQGLAYELLIPSSDAGITNRGVPESVSI